ncbi:MAG: insulinase family protein [Acidobacteriota bacterium]|nr:insulinase family protein [Acidobacteriota bacterium]
MRTSKQSNTLECQSNSLECGGQAHSKDQSAAKPAHSKVMSTHSKVAKLPVRILALLFCMFVSGVVSGQTPAPQATPPPPAPPRSVRLPKPIEKTLGNGLRIVVVERPGTPLVAAQMLIKNGGEVDPPELAGLSNMTADLLTKGTEKRSATQIAEAIEALGASLDTAARWDASRVNINVMSSKVGPALEIMSDVVLHPTFKEDEIERLKQQTIDDLTVELGDPGSIARYVAARIVFGDAPYGQPLGGTPQSIARITRADFVKYHSQFYRPDNAILVLGGDIKAADAFKLAQQLFGNWKKPATPLPSLAAPKPMDGAKTSRVIVIDKPDAGQAAVVIARTGIERADPDYYRGLVTNSVLSGYSGRLNQEIRIKRGLSYGAGSSLETRRQVGPFLASAQTKNPSAAQVASLLVNEVSRLSSAPVPDIELEPRKAVVIGGFSRNLETAAGLVNQIGALALYGINFDEINRYISTVQGINAADVQRFAGAHLDAKGINIIVVGNAKDFLPELQKQYPQVEVIPVAELDLNTALLRKKQQAD